MWPLNVEPKLFGFVEEDFFRLNICKAKHIIPQAAKEPQYLLSREESFVADAIISLESCSDISITTIFRFVRALRKERW